MNTDLVNETSEALVGTLTDLLTQASGVDGFNYLALMTILPRAMELAARNANLTGPERREVVIQAVIKTIQRAPDGAFGDMSRAQLLEAAQAGVPITIDLLYAAYRHRHEFRRRFARLWKKMTSCCRGGCCARDQ